MKYFFILLFSIGLSKLSLAQEGTLQKFDLKITYELSYLGDSTDLNTKRSESTLLFIQGDNSLFETANSHLRDSLDFISVTEGERKYSYFNYKIVREGDKLITYDNILPNRYESGSEGYSYLEEVSDLDWKLSEDTLSINGAVCQKATVTYGNRQWIAYFDPSIPIFEGPYKFKGLPGLIIQVSDSQDHWSFSLTNIEEGDQQFFATIEPVVNFPLIEKKAFFKNKRSAENNFVEIQEAKHGRNPDPIKRERINKSFRKALQVRSNWIELY